MSKFGRCPECEIGDLFVQEYIPEWSDEVQSYYLQCTYCDYTEGIDYDPDEEDYCLDDHRFTNFPGPSELL